MYAGISQKKGRDATMVLQPSDDFSVEWPDPTDAGFTWFWDNMHCPRPLPPLAADLTRGWQQAIGMRRLVVNGYMYMSFGAPAAGPPFALRPPPAGADPLRMWEDDALPRIKELLGSIRQADYESMTAARLGGMLDDLFSKSGQAMALTFGPHMIFGMATNQLMDFCERELGRDGALRATTMVQGIENESAAAGLRLSELAEMAAAAPEVAKVLREGRFDDLASVAGGGPFLADLESYLDLYGWRLETWAQLHLPTWAEDRTVPLRLISRYMDDPDHAPAAFRRSAAQREAAVADAEARIGPDKIERFRSLLKAAQAHVPVSEGRALWQLTSAGVLRIPLMSLGRKLVEAGRLEGPDDVFFLRLEELRELSESAAVTQKAAVAERRGDLERWSRLIPPRFLGAPPPAGMLGGMARFFGFGGEQGSDRRVVSGLAGSAGRARGRARVILDLKDADRLGAGEVLVCRSTAPTWTALFAVAGAVVTDSGGVLSHSAIAAREYAIPAVVGTQVGTQRIPDGALVTVDGSQGVVRIED